MKLTKRLSPAVIEAAKPEESPYRIWDTTVPQLFVRIQPSGIKSFNVQWSRTSSKSLGKWPGVTVGSARTKAKAALVETDKHGAPLVVVEARKPASEKPITLGAFIEKRYAPWALANQKAGQATLDALDAQFKDLNDKRLTDVCAFDIERFKSARIKAGIKPATVNRDLDRIRSVLSRAVEWGRLTKHPMRDVKRIKGVDNDRVRFLTATEEKRLRAALAKRETTRRKERERMQAWQRVRGKAVRPDHGAFTDHLAPLVLLAMNSGLRRGELFGLKWENVNLAGKLLTVPAGIAKSRKGRHVPLNAEALDVLTRWKGKSERSGLVFPGPGGGRLTNINKSWAALVAAAGLEDFNFHDLRHHFASRLVQNGVDLYSVKELLGHSDFKMTQRYAHLAPDHLAAAVAKLGAR
jgi:integrase